MFSFFFQAEDGIRDLTVTGVQTCALPISCCRWRGTREAPELRRRRGSPLRSAAGPWAGRPAPDGGERARRRRSRLRTPPLKVYVSRSRSVSRAIAAIQGRPRTTVSPEARRRAVRPQTPSNQRRPIRCAVLMERRGPVDRRRRDRARNGDPAAPWNDPAARRGLSRDPWATAAVPGWLPVSPRAPQASRRERSDE